MRIKVIFTKKKNYPVAIKKGFKKIYIHHFLLEDDLDWDDFIDELNWYRRGYLQGTIEKLKKVIKTLDK